MHGNKVYLYLNSLENKIPLMVIISRNKIWGDEQKHSNVYLEMSTNSQSPVISISNLFFIIEPV